VIRDFRPADQATVRSLVLAGMAERWGAAFDPTRNPDVDDLVRSYGAAGAEILVAEEDGAVVGTGILVPFGPGTGRIVRVAVHAGHRRRGLARAVVDQLVMRAAARDWSTVVVTTEPAWADAFALYRSCGFAVVAERPDQIRLARSLDRTPPLDDLLAAVRERKRRLPHHVDRDTILGDRDADRR
jgi:ribosomal protein S18 acetylase RimI-like enzyme